MQIVNKKLKYNNKKDRGQNFKLVQESQIIKCTYLLHNYYLTPVKL